jgi:hypothetical protein
VKPRQHVRNHLRKRIYPRSGPGARRPPLSVRPAVTVIHVTDTLDTTAGFAAIAIGCGSPEGAYLVGMTSPR